jgi:hypothetical protein
VRGAIDGIASSAEPQPFRQFFLELRSVLPPLTVYHLWVCGAGTRGVVLNLASAVAIAGLSAWLIDVTGSAAQWIAMGVGLYAALSWVQSLGLRDRPSASLIFGSPSLLLAGLGLSFLAFTGYGIGGWTPVFFMRVHAQSSGDVGIYVGLTAASAGLIGVTLGGWLADHLRQRAATGRLWVALGAGLLAIPLALWLLATDSVVAAYIINFPLTVLASMWIGIGASTVQDLVLPRMRAVASAFYIMALTFIGLALGPYTIGQLSDGLGDLPQAMRLALLANGVAGVLILLAMRHLKRDEATLRERARAAGEPGLEAESPGGG